MPEATRAPSSPGCMAGRTTIKVTLKIKMLVRFAFVAAALVRISAATDFVTTNAGTLLWRGEPLFLSGANQAWVNYGRDFGNHQPGSVKCELESYIDAVAASGGNSIRIWLFTEGETIPAFGKDGMVTAADAANTLENDLRNYLQYAASKNVFVVVSLWNGALMRQSNVKNLFSDDTKLQSFLDNALSPLVAALADEPALAAWEIMNEPEGSVAIAADDEPCFSTSPTLTNSGAGWSASGLKMEDILRFHNRHAAAIHEADPKALVTTGSWSEFSSTNAVLEDGRLFFNFYSDDCLVKAGGSPNGTLDFAQIHTYAHGGAFSPGSPMRRNASEFELKIPIVIGEFSAKPSGKSIESLYEHALAHGYAGAWDWALVGGGSDGNDDASTAYAGMVAIANASTVNVVIGGTPPADTCSCSDDAPDSTYTCAQQAEFGKCQESWMKGWCCRSCFQCNECTR